jgi:hypothetical protein
MFYYKVQTMKPVNLDNIKQYDSLNKYFILHVNDSAWHLTELDITSHDFSGIITVLPDNRFKYKSTKTNCGNRYKKNNESYVLEEVHIYLQDSLFTGIKAGDKIKIAVSTISKVEVYKKAAGRTVVSWVIPVIVPTVIVGGVAIFVVVLFALESIF